MFKKIFICGCMLLQFFLSKSQTKKFDTTVKMGDVGYKILCSNKKPQNNLVTITPVGFTDHPQALTFSIVGILKKALIDDYTGDGNPDLFFYSFDDKNRAQPYGLASVNNKTCAPIYMPDVYNDPKLRDGYQGNDEFSSMGGFIIRKFPIYKTDSSASNNNLLGERMIEYKAKANSSGSENPTYKFEVFAEHDMKQ